MDRLILFDIDGTLIDSAGAGRRAMIRAFHHVVGKDGVEEHADNLPFAGMTDAAIFENLAGALGVDGEDYREIQPRLASSYLDALSDEMSRSDDRRRALPGVMELVEELSTRQRVFQGLLTGNLEAGARIKLQPFGLNGYFTTGGFGSDSSDRREVARVARRRLTEQTRVEFAAEQIFVIGDTENDIDCARANGFIAVAVASGWCSRAKLEHAGPDVLLDDLGDTRQSLDALGL